MKESVIGEINFRILSQKALHRTMALTSKADQDLPVLTRLYQVENKTELESFFTEEWTLAGGQIVDILHPDWTDEAAMKLYNDLWQATRHIMESRFKGTPPPPSALEFLLTVRKETMGYIISGDILTPGGLQRGRLGLVFPGIHENLSPDDWRRLRFAPLVTHPDKFNEAVRALEDVINNVSKVAQCQECDAMFIVRRGSPEYCSYRCADRVAKRKKRSSQTRFVRINNSDK